MWHSKNFQQTLLAPPVSTAASHITLASQCPFIICQSFGIFLMKLLFHKITSILNIAGSSFTVREQTLCGSWERLTPSRHTGTRRFKTSLNPSLWRKECAPRGLHSLDETHPKVSSICASQNAWWCTASHTHSPTLPRGQWQMTYIGLQTQNPGEWVPCWPWSHLLYQWYHTDRQVPVG